MARITAAVIGSTDMATTASKANTINIAGTTMETTMGSKTSMVMTEIIRGRIIGTTVMAAKIASRSRRGRA
jgi:hypothetical protein